jgi:N4-gp56 family major capsid protein
MATLGASTVNLTDTSASSLGGTANSAGLVQAAYDRMVEFALRSQPLIRSVADKRPARQAMPGSSVALQLYKDLAQKTSTLSESADVDTLAMATPDIVTVTLNEYGNAALTTRKLDLFSLADVDPAVANIIAFNMADSVDELAQNELRTGTNVIRPDDTGSAKTLAYNTGAITDIDTNDIITGASIRFAVAKLRANKAMARKNNMFWAGIHPEVSHDLRAETGVGGWRIPHEYQTNENIWSGEIGSFEGAFFIESPRLYSGVTAGVQAYEGASTGSGSFTNTGGSAGTSTQFTITLTAATTSGTPQVGYLVTGTNVGTNARLTAISADGKTLTVSVANAGTVSGTITFQPTTKVYRTFFCGQQALAEAVAEEPHVVIGPVVDRLMRFRPIGWYGVLGFKVYRNEALVRIESASSIA